MLAGSANREQQQITDDLRAKNATWPRLNLPHALGRPVGEVRCRERPGD
jgi:hypothetical protein